MSDFAVDLAAEQPELLGRNVIVLAGKAAADDGASLSCVERAIRNR